MIRASNSTHPAVLVEKVNMRERRVYTVYPSDLQIASAFRQYGEFLQARGYVARKKGSEDQCFSIEVSPHRSFGAEDFDEFLAILGRYPHSLPIELGCSWEKNKTQSFWGYIHIEKSRLRISVSSADLDIISSVHDALQQCFQASNPDASQRERLSRYGLKKSIFVAHRFDKTGVALATTMGTFLRRLGFDVKEGAGYETKNIPEKVAKRINAQDIFLCVVSPGDTSWVLSEAAYAKGRNKYLIVVCQTGVSFNKGIIGGDYEHLSFPRMNIEKCFSDLVYALPI